jgi:hypothetical protein
MGVNVYPGPTFRTVDFTSSGTWVCPAGVFSAEFLVVAAGGAGGGTANSVSTRNSVAGGGGGGQVIKRTLATTPGSSYTITIGAKGTGANASAGTNGGNSEVLLSGTSLILCYGGRGANGIDATDQGVSSTAAPGSTGGSARSDANTVVQYSGGGGGGSVGFIFADTTGTNFGGRNNGGSVGSVAVSSANGTAQIGALGVDGFGSGGNGAKYHTTQAIVGVGALSAPAGAGAGATLDGTTGVVNGGNATIAGCGGGGSASVSDPTAAKGGDGADGLVRISYYG